MSIAADKTDRKEGQEASNLIIQHNDQVRVLQIELSIAADKTDRKEGQEAIKLIIQHNDQVIGSYGLENSSRQDRQEERKGGQQPHHTALLSG